MKMKTAASAIMACLLISCLGASINTTSITNDSITLELITHLFLDESVPHGLEQSYIDRLINEGTLNQVFSSNALEALPHLYMERCLNLYHQEMDLCIGEECPMAAFSPNVDVVGKITSMLGKDLYKFPRVPPGPFRLSMVKAILALDNIDLFA